MSTVSNAGESYLDWTDTSGGGDTESHAYDTVNALEPLGYLPDKSTRHTDVQSIARGDYLLIRISNDSSGLDYEQGIYQDNPAEAVGAILQDTKRINVQKTNLEEQIEVHQRKLDDLRILVERGISDIRSIKRQSNSIQQSSRSNSGSFNMGTNLTLGDMDPVDLGVGVAVGFFMLSVYFNRVMFAILGAALILLAITHDDW